MSNAMCDTQLDETLLEARVKELLELRSRAHQLNLAYLQDIEKYAVLSRRNNNPYTRVHICSHDLILHAFTLCLSAARARNELDDPGWQMKLHEAKEAVRHQTASFAQK